MLPRSIVRPAQVCVLLVALAGGPALRAADEPPPPDLALVPADVPAFLCLQIGPYWDGREAEALKKISQAHPVVVTSMAKDLEKGIGLSLADVERAVVVFPSLAKMGDFVAILTTHKPFNRAKVFGALAPEAKEEKVGTTMLFTSAESPHGVGVVNERTLLVGRADAVRAFLTRPAAAGGGALTEAIKSAAGKHLLVVGMVPTAFLAAVKNAGPQARPFVPLMEAKSWQLVVDAEKDLQLHVRMRFASEESAKEGATGLKAVASSLASYFEFAGKQMPPFLKRESEKYPGVKDLAPRLEKALESARAGLKDFTPERKGTTVLGSVRVKTDEPATAFVLLLSMAPRPAKQ